MKPTKPKSITVFAILNFVFGGFGLLLALMGLIGSLNPSFTGGNSKLVVILMGSAMTSIIVGVLAIISGIGLVKLANWARGCAIAYCVVAILGAFFYVLLTRSSATIGGANQTESLVQALIGGVFRLAYPVVLLVFLRSRSWGVALTPSDHASTSSEK